MLRRFALLVLFTAAARAATVDPALIQELRWRLIGPFRGGRVLAVTGVTGEPEHFYFGSVNGGVWETHDAGRTWQPIFDGQPIGSIGAIAVAPSDPKVIYAGSGESDMRSDISQGNGMYRSGDGGTTWSHIGLGDSQQIARIRVHPADPNVVYVAALGHPYGPNAERGVFRSKDGGQSWQRILSRNNDSDTGAIDLAFEPGNPRVLYAALWQTRRTPWSVYPPSNGPGTGLFKSTDGGDTWTELRNGLPEKPGRIGIAVAPSNPRRVYAIIDAAAGGMYRSDDAGANWTRTSADTRIWGRGWYFGEIAVEPDDQDVVYSMNINLYRSADGGKNFAPIKGAPGGDDYHAMWIDPQTSARRILGVDQGAVVSVNGGATWSSWYNQPTAQLYHVSTDNAFPYRVYGAQQDSGAASLPSRTNTIDGITMMQFRETTAGGESDHIAPDPKDPEVIYGGRVDKLDLRTQQTRSVDPTFANLAGDERRTWTLPLVFSVRDPRVLYFANQRLYRTEDGGERWTIVSPDLTREDPGVPPNLDPTTAALHQRTGPRRGVIYAIAPSRVADRDLWVGTDDGLIWRTRDEGAHWQNVTPAGVGVWSKIGIIDASHFDAETAYAAVDRHRLDDFRPYIYRTHDGGKSWRLIVNGIPANYAVNVVREDAVVKGLLYAGTERGIFVSFDDGDEWQPLQLNLPVTSVRDIDVHGNDLVIATHGRSFWILDDVTPLRQRVTARPFLFAPAAAVRERAAGFTGTPMPLDEPLAANPPQGAYIDYALDKATAVTLDIFNDRNELVRRYDSANPPPPLEVDKLRTAPQWFVLPVALQTTPGMHRFVWPIRHEGPRGEWSNGVWAPPGDYRVVLTVDGKKLEQPLRILPDPRVKLPNSAYAEQYALARKIDALRARIAEAIKESDALLDKTMNESSRTRIVEVAGPDLPFGSTAGPNVPQSPATFRFLLNALENLLEGVDGADAAPSLDARAGFTQLQNSAERVFTMWRAITGSVTK